MDHKWHIKEYRDGSKVHFCSDCGQEWPLTEEELFPKIAAMPCPNFHKVGPWMIEFSKSGKEPFGKYSEAYDIRSAIDICYNKFEHYCLRLYNQHTREEIIP